LTIGLQHSRVGSCPAGSAAGREFAALRRLAVHLRRAVTLSFTVKHFGLASFRHSAGVKKRAKAGTYRRRITALAAFPFHSAHIWWKVTGGNARGANLQPKQTNLF
jgi:hypothetical protein